MKISKERVDILLVEQGLFETREKAKRAIMAGIVYSNEVRVDKPGEKVDSSTVFTVKGKQLPYVSRGGLKLEKALQVFDLTAQDKTLLDIGASTGGFTDCALQNGAKMSYALDVGYNQLAWKLRNDERVEVMERTNFRYVTPDQLKRGLPDFASIDVSFISLKLILPVLKTLLVSGSDVIALVKPQFEAGRQQVGKKGIVRDKSVHEDVMEEIIRFSLATGFDCLDASFSPITGGDGNIEFLLHLQWNDKALGENKITKTVEQIVNEAHQALKSKKQEEMAD